MSKLTSDTLRANLICAGEEETPFPQMSVLDSTNPEEQTKHEVNYRI